jgi:hypothetical protein
MLSVQHQPRQRLQQHWMMMMMIYSILSKETAAPVINHSSLCKDPRVRYCVCRNPPLIHIIIPTHEYKTLDLWVKLQHRAKSKDKRTPPAFTQLLLVRNTVQLHSEFYFISYCGGECLCSVCPESYLPPGKAILGHSVYLEYGAVKSECSKINQIVAY